MRALLLLLLACLALAGCTTQDVSTPTGDEGPGSSLDESTINTTGIQNRTGGPGNESGAAPVVNNSALRDDTVGQG